MILQISNPIKAQDQKPERGRNRNLKILGGTFYGGAGTTSASSIIGVTA
jgi:hypothetical protein